MQSVDLTIPGIHAEEEWPVKQIFWRNIRIADDDQYY